MAKKQTTVTISMQPSVKDKLDCLVDIETKKRPSDKISTSSVIVGLIETAATQLTTWK